MTNVTLNFLGIPRFERAATPIPFAQAKGTALLLYLAVTRTPQPRQRLIDLLWPESLPQAARKNMRNTLWAIGETLGPDLLQQEGNTLSLSPAAIVDIHALENGLKLLENGSLSALEQIAAYYRGTLADGLVVHEAPDFEHWLEGERERLSEIYLCLLERVLALLRADGAWQAVTVQAQRALTADPLRESLHLALIEAYAELGQRPQAMQQYTALTEILQRELGVAPLPQTTARYEALLTVADGAPTSLSPTKRIEPAAPLSKTQKRAAPFVGRQMEMAALDAECQRAAQGEVRVVMITGDLGMGKTHLWRTWAARQAADAVILSTHTLQTTEPVPFAPLLNLFRQPGPAQTILRAPLPLAPIWLAELARLLPELALLWPNLPPVRLMSPTEERARLLQALTETFRLLATPLLVLVIDDLHWADPSTLDWLVYLVDQLKDTPLLLIGTYRPQDAPAQLLTAVAGWQRQGRLRQLPLAHLTPAEAGALLVELGTPEDTTEAPRWIQQSGGNPYFLTELQRAHGDAAQPDLSALVRARIHAGVPDQAIPVLQAAAILGDDVSFALLQATSGRSEEELLDILDLLTQETVFTAENQSYRFVHPLVATVLRADLSPARRAFLHRRAAEAIKRLHTSPSAQAVGLLMEHLAGAGERREAAHYADLAAQQASQVGAFVETVGYARRAVEWEATAPRHLALGRALMFSGTAAEAQTHLETALHLFEQDQDGIGSVNAAMTLALIAISNGRHEDARRWLARPTLAQDEALNPALCAEASLVATTVERYNQDYAAALNYLDQAERLVKEHNLTALAMQAAFERGNLLANRGEIGAAVVAFAKARQVAEDTKDVFGAALAGNNLAYHTFLAGDIAQAQTQIDAALALTERYQLNLLAQYIYSTAGEIALAQHDLTRAEEVFERAFAAAQARDNRTQMANIRASQALVAQAQHNLAQARTLAAEARALFGDANDHFVRNRIERVSDDVCFK
jgi:DNA-binding SARP family transcriptional activator